MIPYVWSYGMGAESTAGILRMITDPAARPETIAPDFSNLVVVIAQTGDEWSTTGKLVQHYILPLLRRHNIRLVEVARRGPAKKDGVAVLQDTRQPYQLHLDGVYKLSRENRVTGTMPQLGGVRKCSQKAKGAPQDAWRATEFGDQLYIHAIGFNVNEYIRIMRDSAYSMGGQRIPTYPIYEWGWSRQDCLDYLYRKLGAVWSKSCCRHCPYAGNRSGWPEQLARFAALPTEAAQHIIDEYVCLALNPRSGLFGPGKSLITRLHRDRATEPITLAAARMKTMPWAIYRVRRLYYAPATAARSVDCVLRGGHRTVHTTLTEVSRLADITVTKNEEIAGAPVRDGDRDTHRRLWLRRPCDETYPTQEEFYTVAPAQARDKELDGFAVAWAEHTDEALAQLERRVDMAIVAVQHAVIDTQGGRGAA
ncbi:hypothetical protein [Actinocrispum wychmicini]|uniref:hypothetical protein n=1 Tax=Actinocrispum wychmicini TaxID=1213861 RepID=UPI001A9DF1EB|nr:hypothetical protein [Actinocrispum wychmicini]